MFTAILSVLTSGAGGGLIGGVLGIFKQIGERKERLAMAQLELDRDKIEAEERHKDREHQLTIMKAGAKIELDKLETETEAEIEITSVNALKDAQSTLKGLKTSTGMDNFRASVRPVLAYLYTFLFLLMSIWAFSSFGCLLSIAEKASLLVMLIETLIFATTSTLSFYFVSRRNASPKL